MTFQSDFVGYEWARVLLGVLSIILFIASVVTAIFAIINAISKKAPSKFVFFIAIAISTLYLIMGSITSLICTLDYEVGFTTDAFKVLLYQIFLLVLFIIFDKNPINATQSSIPLPNDIDEEIDNLSPELKAMLLTGVLQRKDFDDDDNHG